jgi:hypothetical protein
MSAEPWNAKPGPYADQAYKWTSFAPQPAEPKPVEMPH